MPRLEDSNPVDRLDVLQSERNRRRLNVTDRDIEMANAALNYTGKEKDVVILQGIGHVVGTVETILQKVSEVKSLDPFIGSSEMLLDRAG